VQPAQGRKQLLLVDEQAVDPGPQGGGDARRVRADDHHAEGQALEHRLRQAQDRHVGPERQRHHVARAHQGQALAFVEVAPELDAGRRPVAGAQGLAQRTGAGGEELDVVMLLGQGGERVQGEVGPLHRPEVVDETEPQRA
jgi:hypothetical protein